MSDDRIYELMALVLVCRKRMREKNILVTFEIESDCESLWIMRIGENCKYTNDSVINPYTKDDFRRINDTDNLDEGEKHLRRLLHELDG